MLAFASQISPRTVAAALLAALSCAGTAEAEPRRYTLDRLVEMARRSYPGVEAARQAVAAMEAKLFQARWAWIPQGTVTGLLAPAPERRCKNMVVNGETINCIKTEEIIRNDSLDSISIKGVYGRIELELGMPLYTFDKLGAAKRAALAGLSARKAQVKVAQHKVAADVAKAYWGLKLAREILHTVKEGQGHLVKAIKKVEADLDQDKGEVTESDRLRLKTAAAEVESRLHEAKKGEELARVTLAALTGIRDRDFDVDEEVLEVIPGKTKSLTRYLELAHQNRPEVKALKAAGLARQAAVDLEKSRFYPDLLLVMMAGYGAASSVDDPDHGYYSDPFNFLSAGFGLAMRWKWDQVQQYGKYRVARAEAGETDAKRREALMGLKLEVRKAVLEQRESLDRLASRKKGSKAARSWLVATVQNLEAGLASPKDLVDSLVAYFQMHLKYLEAVYDVNVGWYELGRVTGVAHNK
jgi:outer membrane protein TolC